MFGSISKLAKDFCKARKEQAALKQEHGNLTQNLKTALFEYADHLNKNLGITIYAEGSNTIAIYRTGDKEKHLYLFELEREVFSLITASIEELNGQMHYNIQGSCANQEQITVDSLEHLFDLLNNAVIKEIDKNRIGNEGNKLINKMPDLHARIRGIGDAITQKHKIHKAPSPSDSAAPGQN